MANTSPLSEGKRPPKPANQGRAGKANVSPAIHAANTNGSPGMSGVDCESMKKPGSGTRGGGQEHNTASRT